MPTWQLTIFVRAKVLPMESYNFGKEDVTRNHPLTSF